MRLDAIGSRSAGRHYGIERLFVDVPVPGSNDLREIPPGNIAVSRIVLGADALSLALLLEFPCGKKLHCGQGEGGDDGKEDAEAAGCLARRRFVSQALASPPQSQRYVKHKRRLGDEGQREVS